MNHSTEQRLKKVRAALSDSLRLRKQGPFPSKALGDKSFQLRFSHTPVCCCPSNSQTGDGHTRTLISGLSSWHGPNVFSSVFWPQW